jgi:Na+/H+ antiporter NhaC
LVVLVTSSILTGSIFGDQCSPISDTSILSALSSKISVVRHVESQLPYATLCALLAFIAYFPAAAFRGVPSIVFTLIFAVVLAAIFYVCSSRVESEEYGFVDRIFYKSDSKDTVAKND